MKKTFRPPSGLPVGGLMAELVLIVVGVLFALWLEGWRQDRNDRVREAALLRAVQADLAADSSRLARWRDDLPVQIRAGHALIRLDPDDLPPADSLYRIDADFQRLTPDTWSESAYTAMIASGQLAAIRDPAVVEALTGYYEDILKRARTRASLHRQAQTRMIESMWFGEGAYELRASDVDEMIPFDGDFHTIFGIDRPRFGEWLASHKGLVLFMMTQRILLLDYFGEVEQARALLSRRITRYIEDG